MSVGVEANVEVLDGGSSVGAGEEERSSPEMRAIHFPGDGSTN